MDENKTEEKFFEITAPSGGTAGQLPLPLAMAYIPPQKWTTVYDAAEALKRGTVFPALDLPFEGENSR